MKKLFLYIALFTTCISHAHICSVRLGPQLVLPHSLKLSDYETTSAEILFENLLLTDIPATNETYGFAENPLSETQLNFTKETYPAGTDIYYLGSANKQFSIAPNLEAALINKQYDILDTGRIQLYEKLRVTDNRPIYSAAGTSPTRESSFEYDVAFHPFEPVTLQLARGAEAARQFKVGEPFQDIALMGMIYQDRINKEDDDAALRQLGNQAAIIVAVILIPETGGGSLAAISADVTVLAGAVARMDEEVQKERRENIANENYDKNKDFYEAWDTFYTAVGVVDLAAGGTLAVTKLSKANILDNFNNAYTKLKTKPNLYSKIKGRWLVRAGEVHGAGKFSDEVLEAWAKFDDNVLDVASVGKQNWKTFQNRVSEQLQSLHPGKKIGNQITLDVTYIENGITKTKTIIPDNLIQIEVNGIKKYKVIDAKTAQTDLVNKTDLTSSCTQNQQPIYKMIDGDATAGSITKVEMRGGQAEQAFGISSKTEIQLETGVEFWVNSSTTDFTQYIIRPRIK